MELEAAKMIGAGLAAIALAGAGVGIGIIFGNYLSGAMRNKTISAHFHGTLISGDVFWTSIEGEPLTIELSKLIIGCQKIISLMKKGDKWKVFIDPTMAYGEEGRPGIPSNSILIFEIELLDITESME